MNQIEHSKKPFVIQYKKQIYIGIAFLIIVLATYLRLIGLNKGIWLDEYSSLELSLPSNPNFFEDLRNYDHPPTYYILLRIWSSISTNEAFLRIPSIVFGILTIIVIMLILKDLSLEASLLAGFISATLPMFLRYSQEIRDYSLLFLAIALTFYSANQSMRTNKIVWYIILTISLLIVVSTHIVGVMIIPCLCVYLFLQRNTYAVHWRRFSIPIIVSGLVFGFIFLVFMQKSQKTSWWMPELSTALFISQFKYIFSTDFIFYPVRKLNLNNPGLASILDKIIKLAIFTFGFIIIFFGQWRKGLPYLAGSIVYWLEIIVVTLLILPVFWYRTLMPALVMFVLFLALQTSTVSTIKLKVPAIISLVFICGIMAQSWAVTEAKYSRELWRETAQALATQYQPHDLVIFYPVYVEGPIKYYFPNINNDNVIVTKIADNLDSVKHTIELKLNNPQKPQNIFFVTRKDLLSDNDVNYRSGLLQYLSSVGAVSPQQTFGVISITAYRVNP